MTHSTQLPGKGGTSTCSADAAAELVNKIEISASYSPKRRRNTQKRRVKALVSAGQGTALRQGKYAIAMTLTFKNNSDYSSQCLRAFTEKARRWLKRRGHTFTYVWVLERANRLHYHLMVWLPRGIKLDHAQLASWWPWGSTWAEACKSVRDWGLYIAKFNSEKAFCKNTRLYGHGGFDAAAKFSVLRAYLPIWLQKLLPNSERATRARGGGWVNQNTGEIYSSPYRWTPRGMVRVMTMGALFS